MTCSMNRAVDLMKAVECTVRTIFHIGVFASLLLVCFWPAILNGYPLFGTDTLAYIRYVDIGVTTVTGHKSDWATPAIAVTPVAPQASPETTGDANAKAPFAGRSVYYGALLQLGVIVGSMWVSIAVQAAALMLAIALILHSTVGYNRLAFTGLIIALSVTTPVAIYVSFLSPDLFAGLTILAVAALLVYGERMSRRRATGLDWAAVQRVAVSQFARPDRHVRVGHLSYSPLPVSRAHVVEGADRTCVLPRHCIDRRGDVHTCRQQNVRGKSDTPALSDGASFGGRSRSGIPTGQLPTGWLYSMPLCRPTSGCDRRRLPVVAGS